MTIFDATSSIIVFFGCLVTMNSIFCLTKQDSCIQLYTSDCIIVLYSGVSTQNCVIVSCTIVVFCCTYDSPADLTPGIWPSDRFLQLWSDGVNGVILSLHQVAKFN